MVSRGVSRGDMLQVGWAAVRVVWGGDCGSCGV